MSHDWIELLGLYGVLPVAFAFVVVRFGYRGAMAPILWLFRPASASRASDPPGVAERAGRVSSAAEDW